MPLLRKIHGPGTPHHNIINHNNRAYHWLFENQF